MAHAGVRFGIFLAPFHQLGDNPTLALERDLELIEWLDHLGYDEAWIGEHHSAGWEIIASPEIFIAAAAVADWRVKSAASRKTKKGPKGPAPIELVENPDILATVSKLKKGRPKLVVGFAAETENLVANAQAKLARKGCDLIVANDVGAEQEIFGGDENRVVIVDSHGAEPWAQAGKDDVAERLVALLATRLGAKS